MSPTSGSVGAPPARVHCKRAVRLSPAPALASTFGGPAVGGRLKPLQTDEQERGEVAGRNFKVPDGNVDPSAADLGLSKQMRRNIRASGDFRILGGRAVPNGRDPLGGMSRPPLGSLRVTEVMTPRLLLNWKPPGKRQGVGRLARARDHRRRAEEHRPRPGRGPEESRPCRRLRGMSVQGGGTRGRGGDAGRGCRSGFVEGRGPRSPRRAPAGAARPLWQPPKVCRMPTARHQSGPKPILRETGDRLASSSLRRWRGAGFP